MRILHINTASYGGAAIAALRIHQGCLNAGFKSYFLFLEDNGFSSIESGYKFPKFYPTKWQKILDCIGIKKFTFKEINTIYSKAKGDFDVISFPVSDYRVNKHFLFDKVDIIHIHWIGNFVNLPSFFKNCNKPVVWTLHDKNPAMGCFHLELDKKRDNNFKILNNRFQYVKKEALLDFENLSLVFPSKKLMKYVQQKSFLRRYPHYHILNPVNEKEYRLINKSSARNVLNLPESKKIILVFCHSLSVYHKGMDLFFEAINKQKFSNLHFLLVGKINDINQKVFSYTNFPYVHDQMLLNIFYASADFLLIPSREENLPNIMLESMLCGTPVISFALGGMLDVIKPGFNGYLVDDIESKALKLLLEKINQLSYNFNRKNIREFAENNFSQKKQFKKYLKVYRRAIKNCG